MIRALIPLTLALAVAACSDPAPERLSTEEVDRLFARLHATADAQEAKTIEVAILHAWAMSGRPEVDRLMMDGLRALHENQLDRAEAAFTDVIRIAPAYVEGWHLRATLHWMRDRYDPAVRDLRQALVLEPRHFRALNLLGRIFAEVGQQRTALRVLEKALEINPHLEEAQKQIEELRPRLAGLPI